MARFQWIWQWESQKWFVTNAGAFQRDLLSKIESEARSKLRSEGLTPETITHSGVTYWTEWLGQLHRWKGTTTVVFTGSPIALAVVAAIIYKLAPYIIAAVIAWFALETFKSIASVVHEIVEKVPEAIPLAIGAGGAVLILAILFLMGVRAPPRRGEKPVEARP